MSALESVTLRAFEAFARAQRAMYRGGDLRAVRESLAPDVIWHVLARARSRAIIAGATR